MGLYTQDKVYVFTNINAYVPGCSVLIVLLYEIQYTTGSNIRAAENYWSVKYELKSGCFGLSSLVKKFQKDLVLMS